MNLLGGKTGGRFPVKNPPTYMWCSPYSWDLARTTRTWILMRPLYTISSHPAWLHEVCVGQRNGYSSSSELIVIGDGIWRRAPLATPWDAQTAALNWPADTPALTASICSSFCTVSVIRAARAWHCGSIVLNHCLWRWSTGACGMVPMRNAICWCCVKPSHGK